MTIASSKIRFNVDAELALRSDIGQSDLTADAASAPLSLDRLTADWNAGEIAVPQQFVIFGAVTKRDATTGDESYNLILEVSATEDFAQAKTVSSVLITKTGRFTVPVVREALLDADPAAAFLRLRVDVGGTTPVFNYYAYASSYQGA